MKSGLRFVRSEKEVENPLLRPLFNDMIECEEMFDRADTPFVRRSFVRSSFAFIEAHLYWLKDQVIAWLLSAGWEANRIEVSKLMVLFDSAYRPNKQGIMEAEAKRTPFLNLCAFVLRTGAECWGLDPSHIFSDAGWASLQIALNVRHRITHPKRSEDLDITDGEINAMREAHHWMYDYMIALMHAMQGQAGSAASPAATNDELLKSNDSKSD
jgi:hypothetical protein